MALYDEIVAGEDAAVPYAEALKVFEGNFHAGMEEKEGAEPRAALREFDETFGSEVNEKLSAELVTLYGNFLTGVAASEKAEKQRQFFSYFQKSDFARFFLAKKYLEDMLGEISPDFLIDRNFLPLIEKLSSLDKSGVIDLRNLKSEDDLAFSKIILRENDDARPATVPDGDAITAAVNNLDDFAKTKAKPKTPAPTANSLLTDLQISQTINSQIVGGKDSLKGIIITQCVDNDEISDDKKVAQTELEAAVALAKTKPVEEFPVHILMPVLVGGCHRNVKEFIVFNAGAQIDAFNIDSPSNGFEPFGKPSVNNYNTTRYQDDGPSCGDWCMAYIFLKIKSEFEPHHAPLSSRAMAMTECLTSLGSSAANGKELRGHTLAMWEPEKQVLEAKQDAEREAEAEQQEAEAKRRTDEARRVFGKNIAQTFVSQPPGDHWKKILDEKYQGLTDEAKPAVAEEYNKLVEEKAVYSFADHVQAFEGPDADSQADEYIQKFMKSDAARLDIVPKGIVIAETGKTNVHVLKHNNEVIACAVQKIAGDGENRKCSFSVHFSSRIDGLQDIDCAWQAIRLVENYRASQGAAVNRLPMEFSGKNVPLNVLAMARAYCEVKHYDSRLGSGVDEVKLDEAQNMANAVFGSWDKVKKINEKLGFTAVQYDEMLAFGEKRAGEGKKEIEDYTPGSPGKRGLEL